MDPVRGPVRVSYRPCTVISNDFHFLRNPYSAHAGPARVSYGNLTDTEGNRHKKILQKSHTGVVYGRTGAVRVPHGPHMGCLQADYGL